MVIASEFHQNVVQMNGSTSDCAVMVKDPWFLSPIGNIGGMVLLVLFSVCQGKGLEEWFRKQAFAV